MKYIGKEKENCKKDRDKVRIEREYHLLKAKDFSLKKYLSKSSEEMAVVVNSYPL